MDQKPSVGRTVHYVSYGTPGGEFGKECRAAIVTEVSAEDSSIVGLCVLNPTGHFFNRGCKHHDGVDPLLAARNSKPSGLPYPGGTWHWPERV